MDANELAKARDLLRFIAPDAHAPCGNATAPPETRHAMADRFAAHLVWMSDQALFPWRSYDLRTGTMSVGAQVSEIKYRLDIDTMEQVAAKHLEFDDVAGCNLLLDRPVAFDRCGEDRDEGSFVLVDRVSEATVGCGVIEFALRRASNIHWRAMRVGKALRAAANGQRPCAVWFTGLSGAGKSTVADLVEQRLHAMGRRTMLLDGDNVRHGLNRDLGFTDEDRIENVRRVAEVAKLMVEAGLITLVSFISPFSSERRMARGLLEEGEFIEVHVDAPLAVCESRDPKGLYKKARAGELPDFTGIGSVYEPPEAPELRLATDKETAAELADKVIEFLRDRRMI